VHTWARSLVGFSNKPFDDGNQKEPGDDEGTDRVARQANDRLAVAHAKDGRFAWAYVDACTRHPGAEVRHGQLSIPVLVTNPR
jgi:hypothetical protein